MQFDLKSQVEMPRPDFVEPRPVNYREARTRLEHYVKQGPLRLNILRKVLEENGISLGNSNEDVFEVSEFLLENVKADSVSGEPNSHWIEFIWNFGYFIGNIMIDRDPRSKLRWGVENVAIRGSLPKYVICIRGYPSSPGSFHPDNHLLGLARLAIREGKAEPVRVVGEINLSTMLCGGL
ncbi:MAG: hypothetical protein WBC90_04390 [Albidovulum sp.]